MQPDESLPLAILERASVALDITPTQRKYVEDSYKGVGTALCESAALRELSPIIEPQGSFLLGTVVKPDPDSVFDIDATCRLPLDYRRFESHQVFNAVHDVLKAHGVYKHLVKPKNRCLRVEYSDRKFHLDMTPCVPNDSRELAIHVPDRELKIWKPSNPQLYAKYFEDIAVKQPRFESDLLQLANITKALSARIEPIPPEEGFRKMPLKRLVQLLKRHRDLHFKNHNGTVISIVITTLAARAYAKLVEARIYPSMLDFAICVVDEMPNHIRTWVDVARKRHFSVDNPAVEGENFAEKWNYDASLAEAFFKWRAKVSSDLCAFRQATLANRGTPYLIEKAVALYGQQPASFAAREIAAITADQHRSSALRITPSLSLGSSGIMARPTAYYGS